MKSGNDNYQARTSAWKYLSYVSDVIGDKRPVTKALIGTLVEHLEPLEKLDKLPAGTFEPIYRVTRSLESCTGKNFFNWGRFRDNKKARTQLKERWQQWWTENGKDLPETDPTRK